MNLTLLGQMGTFAVLVFFIWRFLWGPLTRLLDERSKRVQDGLAAAERGQREFSLMQHKSVDLLRQARAEAAEVLNHSIPISRPFGSPLPPKRNSNLAFS